MSCLESSDPAYEHLGARPTANLVRARRRGSMTWHHATCNLLWDGRQKQVTREKQLSLHKCNVVGHPLKRAPKAWKSNRTASGRAKRHKFQHLDRDKSRRTNLRGRDNERRQDFPILLHTEREKSKRRCGQDFGTRRCLWKLQNRCKNQRFFFDLRWRMTRDWEQKNEKAIANTHECATFIYAHFDTHLGVSKSRLGHVQTGSWDTRSDN